MRIIVTGSRNWTNRDLIRRALRVEMLFDKPENVTVVHGDARGADRIAGEVAKELGMNVEEYPADWKQYGKKAGPIRNQKMVDLGADVCLAFPMSDSRGTWDCMTRAERAGIPVAEITP